MARCKENSPLSGELSQVTASKFEKAIRLALYASPQEVVVDLAGIDLIDDAWLTALPGDRTLFARMQDLHPGVRNRRFAMRTYVRI
jgi:anti-anti-sigma regulatory factor